MVGWRSVSGSGSGSGIVGLRGSGIGSAAMLRLLAAVVMILCMIASCALITAVFAMIASCKALGNYLLGSCFDTKAHGSSLGAEGRRQ